MSYRYLDETGGDVAFEAIGKSREELFMSAAAATMNVMVEDLGSIHRREEVTLYADHSQFDLLLFRFLNELIFLKDSRKLLIRIEKVCFGERDSKLTVEATGYGETLDPAKHPLHVDVKAVTLHRFQVVQSQEGWKATVVLDV